MALSPNAVRRWLAAGVILSVATAISACRVAPGPKPVFRRDLRPFGFPTQTLGRIVGSFSDVGFLSNDLLLVTVNTQTFGADDETPSDLPESKLLLFDITRQTLLNSVDAPVEKSPDSVQSAGNGSFVLLNREGVQICSLSLECGRPVDTRGPLYLSPQGTRIAVGGHGRWEQKILNGTTLAELQSFAKNEPKVIPGDDGVLYGQKGQLFVKLPDRPEPQLVLDEIGTDVWPNARFLDANTIAALQFDKTMTVATLDGKVLFRIRGEGKSYLTEVSTTASGSRFCLHDAGYTGLRSVLAFLDFEKPFNLERVNVMDVRSGRSRLKLQWDPQPYVGNLTRPALSPDGHRLAIIKHGFVEVYYIR